MGRPTWDEYFMRIAKDTSLMSTCLSRQVGAVAVKDKRIIATGFNGAPTGIKHCDELGGCVRKQKGAKSGEMLDICRAAHAEANVVAQAAKHGISLKGATLYVTDKPCGLCEKAIINVGITKVVYSGDYKHSDSTSMLEEAGIDVEVLSLDSYFEHKTEKEIAKYIATGVSKHATSIELEDWE